MGIIYKKRKYKLQGGSKLLDEESLVKQDATKVDQPKEMVVGKPEQQLDRRQMEDLGLVEPLVFRVSKSPDIIDELNKVSPKRFSKEVLDQYDKYDDSLIEALHELKVEGESADPNVIKAIMLVENSNLIPSKNSLGYEGFPQTKPYIVDSINRRHGTNFTMKDMYDPKESAKFIHYYLKDINKSMYVNSLNDTLAAYNWGIGNLAKMKKGEKAMPKETSDYISLARILLNK